MRSGTLWAFGTLAALLLAGALFIVQGGASNRDKAGDPLTAELALARAEGLPVEPADLRPSPTVPANENAAPVYRQALDWIDARYKYPRAKLLEPLQSAIAEPTSPNLRAASRHMHELAPLVGLVEQAAARERCDFNKTFKPSE